MPEIVLSTAAPTAPLAAGLPPAEILAALRQHARPLTGNAGDTAPLHDLLGRVRFALLGQATHGSHELAVARAEITKRLIGRHHYCAVVIEADWLHTLRINRYVRGLSSDPDAESALGDFPRFPAWLWRNAVMLDFVRWLRAHNDTQPPWNRVGLYGMDLYGLYGPIRDALAYLDAADPRAAARARLRYACLDHFQQDIRGYGFPAGFGTGFSGEDEVARQSLERHRRALAPEDAAYDDRDALFHAQQAAPLARHAEHYHRSLFKGRALSWNLRNHHLADSVEAISGHLAGRSGWPPRVVLWLPNSLAGDAGATAMSGRVECSVGQLMRKRFPGQTALVGFTAGGGSVLAASHWGGPATAQRLQPAPAGSWEALLAEAGGDRLLMPADAPALAQALEGPRLQRSVGVVYAAGNERQSHWFEASMAGQFDAVIHIDQTRAIEPLPPVAEDAGVSATAVETAAA